MTYDNRESSPQVKKKTGATIIAGKGGDPEWDTIRLEDGCLGSRHRPTTTEEKGHKADINENNDNERRIAKLRLNTKQPVGASSRARPKMTEPSLWYSYLPFPPCDDGLLMRRSGGVPRASRRSQGHPYGRLLVRDEDENSARELYCSCVVRRVCAWREIYGSHEGGCPQRRRAQGASDSRVCNPDILAKIGVKPKTDRRLPRVGENVQ
ncbi:hypothetical protein EI94DRAFT_1788286 [Lactarius quietus]|nr:hypothetical protein EI94DRAFT_1788286 [Lactarius quietus]